MKIEHSSDWDKLIEAQTIFTAPRCVNSISPSISPSISTAYLRCASDINDIGNEEHLKDLGLFRYPAIVVASHNGNICTLVTHSLEEVDSTIPSNKRRHHYRLGIHFGRKIKSVALLTHKYVTKSKSEQGLNTCVFHCEDVILFVHTQCGKLWKSNICSKDQTIYHKSTVAFSNGHFYVPCKSPHPHSFQMVECLQNYRNSSRIPLLLGISHISLQLCTNKDVTDKNVKKMQHSADTKSAEDTFIVMTVAGGFASPRIFMFSTKNGDSNEFGTDAADTLRDHHNDLHVEVTDVVGLEEHKSRITFLTLLSKDNLMPILWEKIVGIWNNTHMVAITDFNSCINENKFEHKCNRNYDSAIFIGSKDGSVYCSLFFATADNVANDSNEKTSNLERKIDENCCTARITHLHHIFNINDAKSNQIHDHESIVSIDCIPSFSSKNYFHKCHSHKSSKVLIVGSLGSLYILDPDLSNCNQTTTFRRFAISLPPIGIWISVASCWSPFRNTTSSESQDKDCTLLAVLDTGSTFLFPIKSYDTIHDLNSTLQKIPAGHHPFLIEKNSAIQLKQSSEETPKLKSLPIRKEISSVSVCATLNPFSNNTILFVAFCTFRGAIMLMRIKPNLDVINKQSNQSKINCKKRKTHLLQLQGMDSKTYKIKNELEKQFKALQAASLETRNATRVISKILGKISCYPKASNNHKDKKNSQTFHSKENLRQSWRTEIKYTPNQIRSQASVSLQVHSPLFDCIDSEKVLDNSTCLLWNQSCHIFQSISTPKSQVNQMHPLCSRKCKCNHKDFQMINVVFGGLVQTNTQMYHRRDNAHKNDEIKNSIDVTIPIWDKFASSAIISVQGVYSFDTAENEAWIQCMEETQINAEEHLISDVNDIKQMNKEKQIDVLRSGSIKCDVSFIEGQERVNNRNKEMIGFVVPTQSSRKRIWDILGDLYPLCNCLSIPNQAKMSINRKNDSCAAYNKVTDSVERHAERLVRQSSLKESSKVKQCKIPVHLEDIILIKRAMHRSNKEKASSCNLYVGSFQTSLFHAHDNILKSSYKMNVAGLDALALVFSDPVQSVSSSKMNFRQVIGFAFSGDFVEDDMDGICSIIREGILTRIINCDTIHEVQVHDAINDYKESLICPNFMICTNKLLAFIKGLQLDKSERNMYKMVHEVLQLYHKLRALNILME